jgi:hypothetical protein
MTDTQDDLARKTFEAYFEWAIAPDLAALESVRGEALARMRRWFAGGVGAAGMVLFVAALTSGIGGWAIFWAVFAGLGASGLGLIIVDQVAYPVKRALLPKVAAYVGVSPARNRDVSSIETLQNLRMIPKGDRASFDDFFEGVRAGCPFMLYEAHLQRRHRSPKGRVSYSTCFRGQILRVRVPLRFQGVTVVHRDVSLTPPDLKRARLADPKFEDVFEVYTTDQVEARYLLQPDFMERLLKFEELLRGKSARAVFKDGELLIVMNGGDLFEPGSMFTPLVDIARARKVLEEFELILAIVDSLMARPKEEGADGAAG